MVDGRVSFPVRVTLHDQVGSTNIVRLQDEGSYAQTIPFVLGPCADCSRDLTITADVSSWSTGRHELRFTANVPDEQPNASGDQRMFQSTGIQLCVRSCTPSYRSGDWLEARGWYDGHGYQNARLTSSVASVRSGGTISVRLAPGSEGLPTTGSGVYIDPDFHNGSSGIVVLERSGPFTGSVTLPSLPPGAHRLVLVAHDAQNGGVLLIPFVTP